MDTGAYCTKCGNTGVDIDGNPCTCKFDVEGYFGSVTCLTVPEQYQSVHFNKLLMSADMPEAYRNFMDNLHDDVINGRWKFHNMALCSPASSSKTILAYSCLQSLFRRGLQTFPVYDVMELKRIMYDLDMGKKLLYDVKEPGAILESSVLFVRVPNALVREVYDTMYTLVDRRVRRGNSTIFLYNGSWEELTRLDYNGVIKNMLGNGAFTTIENSTWHKTKQQPIEDFSAYPLPKVGE